MARLFPDRPQYVTIKESTNIFNKFAMSLFLLFIFQIFFQKHHALMVFVIYDFTVPILQQSVYSL